MTLEPIVLEHWTEGDVGCYLPPQSCSKGTFRGSMGGKAVLILKSKTDVKTLFAIRKIGGTHIMAKWGSLMEMGMRRAEVTSEEGHV